MLPTRYGLALAMARSAKVAGDSLKEGRKYGLPHSEETITEITLLNVRKIVASLGVRVLSKREEALRGADWEFWVEGGEEWFSFLVQAKKAKKRNGGDVTYDVAYLSGAKRVPQIDLLIKASRIERPAIYALYNEPGLIPAPYVRGHCKDHQLFEGVDGITTLSASHMDKLSGPNRKAVDAGVAAEMATPWSCLAACPASATCLDRGGSMNSVRPQDLGFDPATSDDDPALMMARAIYHLEIGPEASSTDRATGVWSKEDVPAYVPKQDQSFDPEMELSEFSEGIPVPKYVVSLWAKPKEQPA